MEHRSLALALGGVGLFTVGGAQVLRICAASLHDSSSPNPLACILASSQPELGKLYPLSEDLFVDPGGNVGIGTTTPAGTLDVDGCLYVGGHKVIDDDGNFHGPGARSLSLNRMQVATLRWYSPSLVLEEVPISGTSFGICFDGRDLWASASGLNRVRPSDGAILDTYATPGRWLVYDGAHVWSTIGNQLWKVRARDGVASPVIPGDGFEGLAFDGTHIWVAEANIDVVRKVHAGTGATVSSHPVGAAPYGVMYDGQNVWVANLDSDTVSKLDAATGSDAGPYAVGLDPWGLAFDGTSVWVTNCGEDTVTKLDASDGSVLGTYAVGASPRGVVFDGTDVWIANLNGESVTRLRALDGSHVDTYPLSPGFRPATLAFDGNRIWIASEGSGRIVGL